MTTLNDVELVVIDDDEPHGVISEEDDVGMTDAEIADFLGTNEVLTAASDAEQETFDIVLLDRYIKVMSITTDEAFGSDHNLRAYWTHGEGAAKIRWGTDGSFARCVRHLGKYVTRPQGLCAEYHKAATGQWPTEGGKHGIPSSVDIAVTADAAETASETDTETTVDESGNWEGILVMEGVETGDQRKFSAGSLSWPDPAAVTIPLMWAKANMGEHKGSVIAGRINEIWRDPANPAMVRGRGKFDLGGAEGREAFRMVKEGMLNGISIDPDQISDADVELQFAPAFAEDGEEPDEAQMAAKQLAQAAGMEKPTLTVFHAGRIRGATLVAFPAFVEAQIQLSHSNAVTASGHANQKVSFAQWDGPANDLRVARELDYSVASKAFAYVHPRGKKVKKYDCAYLHHELTDDGKVGPPNMDAVQQAMELVNQGYPQTLSMEARREAYNHLAGHMRFADMETPAFSFDVAADELVACGGDKAPPKEWFDDPKLEGPTPLTVDDEGRVFGHAALWSSCHTSFGDTCVQPPYEDNYGYFTTGEVVCADGSRVAAGQITLGTSHAATKGISAQMAVDHYGNTGTTAADVAAGSDSHGIWVAGAIRPGSSPDRIRELRASALSGDWRRIGGSLRLVAMLAVNVPGFPIPRTTTFTSKGRQLSLVAAGVPMGDTLNQAKMDAQLAALRARVSPASETMATAVELLRARIDSPLGIFKEDDHPRGPLGRFIDSIGDAIDSIGDGGGPKRYGPDGERNYPLHPGEKPTSGRLIDRQLRPKSDGESSKLPKRYGPNGERNYPLHPDEKPTPERVMRKQEKDAMKRRAKEHS